METNIWAAVSGFRTRGGVSLIDTAADVIHFGKQLFGGGVIGGRPENNGDQRACPLHGGTRNFLKFRGLLAGHGRCRVRENRQHGLPVRGSVISQRGFGAELKGCRVRRNLGDIGPQSCGTKDVPFGSGQPVTSRQVLAQRWYRGVRHVRQRCVGQFQEILRAVAGCKIPDSCRFETCPCRQVPRTPRKRR